MLFLQPLAIEHHVAACFFPHQCYVLLLISVLHALGLPTAACFSRPMLTLDALSNKT
jgi:hypothetical protein